MTRFALFAIAAAAAVALAPLVAASATGAACGSAKVGGETVITYCGPAKVTFTFGGKTYHVSGGSCSFDAGSGSWTLLAGRQTVGGTAPKFSCFQGGYLGKLKAGTYTTADLILSFQIPGANWSLALGLPHKITVTTGGKKGVFTGAFYTGKKAGTKPANGSWTC